MKIKIRLINLKKITQNNKLQKTSQIRTTQNRMKKKIKIKRHQQQQNLNQNQKNRKQRLINHNNLNNQKYNIFIKEGWKHNAN